MKKFFVGRSERGFFLLLVFYWYVYMCIQYNIIANSLLIAYLSNHVQAKNTWFKSTHCREFNTHCHWGTNISVLNTVNWPCGPQNLTPMFRIKILENKADIPQNSRRFNCWNSGKRRNKTTDSTRNICVKYSLQHQKLAHSRKAKSSEWVLGWWVAVVCCTIWGALGVNTSIGWCRQKYNHKDIIFLYVST